MEPISTIRILHARDADHRLPFGQFNDTLFEAVRRVADLRHNLRVVTEKGKALHVT